MNAPRSGAAWGCCEVYLARWLPPMIEIAAPKKGDTPMPRIFTMSMAAIALLAFTTEVTAQRNPTSADQIIEGLKPRTGGPSRGLRSVPSQTTEGLRAVPADTGTPASATAAPGTPSPAATASGSPAPAASAADKPPAAAAAEAPSVSLTVQFASGSASLTPAARRALNELGSALSSPDLASFRFLIEGHTDTVGAAGMNLDLSASRAAAVRQYLISQFGIDATRLEAVGRGESDLLIRTPDETPEARNRRVQIINLDG